MYTVEQLIMSHENNCLLFESFLQKRKDTMKLRWVTYWFRLQNTTLFFYTKKNGSASHLRGQYYIYTIQSVREIQNGDNKRFMFEIIMTNAKRKMLAADTAALRKEWVGYLWQAMHLSTSGTGIIQSIKPEACTQENTYSNSEAIYSDVKSVMETQQPCNPSGPLHTDIEPIYQNTAFQQSNDCTVTGGHDRSNEVDGVRNRPEEIYDVLPVRNNLQGTKPWTDVDNGVYDCPISYRRPADHEESPYDVPSALLRKLPADGTEPEKGPCWRI